MTFVVFFEDEFDDDLPEFQLSAVEFLDCRIKRAESGLTFSTYFSQENTLKGSNLLNANNLN